MAGNVKPTPSSENVDKEILENLDLLMNFEVLESEDNWEELSEMGEDKGEDDDET
jgi:hypothetical protein